MPSSSSSSTLTLPPFPHHNDDYRNSVERLHSDLLLYSNQGLSTLPFELYGSIATTQVAVYVFAAPGDDYSLQPREMGIMELSRLVDRHNHDIHRTTLTLDLNAQSSTTAWIRFLHHILWSLSLRLDDAIDLLQLAHLLRRIEDPPSLVEIDRASTLVRDRTKASFSEISKETRETEGESRRSSGGQSDFTVRAGSSDSTEMHGSHQ